MKKNKDIIKKISETKKKNFASGKTLHFTKTKSETDIKQIYKNISEKSKQTILKNKENGKKYTAWNKGLTKETDERVAKYTKTNSISKLGKKLSEEHKKAISSALKFHYKIEAIIHPKVKKIKTKNVVVPWNKGLTKFTDIRVANVGKINSKKLKEKYGSGEIKHWAKGLTKENNTSLRIGGKKRSGNNHWMSKKPLPADFTKKSLHRNFMSSLEIKMNEIIIKYNLPYKFVGNGEFLIENKCPDFLNINGEKKIIEVYCTKHKEMFKNEGCKIWKKKRRELFKKYGYKTIFFNELELNEETILKKIGDKK
jgi:hypothetical protein